MSDTERIKKLVVGALDTGVSNGYGDELMGLPDMVAIDVMDFDRGVQEFCHRNDIGMEVVSGIVAEWQESRKGS